MSEARKAAERIANPYCNEFDVDAIAAIIDEAIAAETAMLRAALEELIAAESAPYPPYEAGREAQNAWSDRREAARKAARAALEQKGGE